MKKMLSVLIVTATLTLAFAGGAEARIFEPQENWWSSGRTCVASRNSAMRRWDAMPPRSCTQRDEREGDRDLRAANEERPRLKSKFPVLDFV